MGSRSLLVLLALVGMGITASAQAVRRKQLLTSLGADAGLITVNNTLDTISTNSTTAGSFTCRFAYALGDRW